MIEDSDFVLIGLVKRARGMGGEVVVEPVSDIIERFSVLKYVLVQTQDGLTEREVETVRTNGRQVALKLHGVDGRSSAEALRGAKVGVRRKDVYSLPRDTYYVFDVVGCKVMGEARGDLGTVRDVLKLPANDVLVLETARGEALIPAVKDVIKEVDLEKKVIVIEEIEGLLD